MCWCWMFDFVMSAVIILTKAKVGDVADLLQHTVQHAHVCPIFVHCCPQGRGQETLRTAMSKYWREKTADLKEE